MPFTKPDLKLSHPCHVYAWAFTKKNPTRISPQSDTTLSQPNQSISMQSLTRLYKTETRFSRFHSRSRRCIERSQETAKGAWLILLYSVSRKCLPNRKYHIAFLHSESSSLAVDPVYSFKLSVPSCTRVFRLVICSALFFSPSHTSQYPYNVLFNSEPSWYLDVMLTQPLLSGSREEGLQVRSDRTHRGTTRRATRSIVCRKQSKIRG